MTTPKTPVVFIHGLWLHATSWQRWIGLFEKAGYEATAPGWPGVPDTVRRPVSTRSGKQTRASPMPSSTTPGIGAVGTKPIVGIYSNVPEGGEVDSTQADWLAREMTDARRELPLAVTLHHPIYSAHAFHGRSAKMGALLDTASARAGRAPDVVLAGHVHNYQRFHRTIDGRTVPYVIAGAGGYWHLHAMAKDADGNGARSIRVRGGWTRPSALPRVRRRGLRCRSRRVASLAADALAGAAGLAAGMMDSVIGPGASA